MGQLTIPPSGNVYLDTCCLIYTIERHTDFFPILAPLWAASQSASISIVCSKLTILECLVGPLKAKDVELVAAYETAFGAGDLRLCEVAEEILRDAAQLRATHNLKTPDAIHAATALSASAVSFITNDPHFERVAGLNVQVISKL